MKRFRHWSGTRIALLAAGWVIGLPLALALVAAVLLWRGLHAYATQSGVVLPPQMSDVFIGVAWHELVVLAGLIVVPPLLLFVAWIWARARGDGNRDAPT